MLPLVERLLTPAKSPGYLSPPARRDVCNGAIVNNSETTPGTAAGRSTTSTTVPKHHGRISLLSKLQAIPRVYPTDRTGVLQSVKEASVYREVV